jgi:hypothetical protein
MSKVATIKTKFTDGKLLLAALQALGLAAEDHIGDPVYLKTYDGEKILADIRIKKDTLPSHSFADIGFSKQKDGSYKAQIADFKTSHAWGQTFINTLNVQYQTQRVMQVAEKKGVKLIHTGQKNGNQTYVFQER